MSGAPYWNFVVDTAGNAIPGASVAVLGPGTPTLSPLPGSPLASIFSDQALTVPLANPITTDLLGRFQFWAAANIYTLQIFGSVVQTYNYPIDLITGSTLFPGGGTNSIQTNVGGAFYGDSNFLYDPTAGLVTLLGPATGGLTVEQTNVATSGGNFSSPKLILGGSVWNGTAGVLDAWTIQNVIGSVGTLPGQTLLVSCNQSNGAVQITTTLLCGQLNSGPIFVGGNVVLTSAAATNLTNISSTKYELMGAWWNGTSSVNSITSFQEVIGAGTTPTDQLVISNTGAFSWNGVVIQGNLQVNGSTTVQNNVLATSFQANVGMATSLANENSGPVNFTASWWNGSAAVGSTTTIQEVVGTGTNPTEKFLISNSGAFNWLGVQIDNQIAATNVLNQSSPILGLSGRYWNGSTSAVNEWTLQDVTSSGTNPVRTLTLTGGSSSGGQLFDVLTAMQVSGNLTCNGSVLLGNGFFESALLGTPCVIFKGNTPATNVLNVSSGQQQITGEYWTGSASADDTWLFQNVLGTGTNPTSAFTLSHSGTPGNTSLNVVAELQHLNSTSGNSAYIQSKTFTLSSAQIKTLHSVPTQILPAPGTGKTILVVATLAHYRFNTTAYTLNGSTAISLCYNNVQNSKPWELAANAGFIDQTSDQYCTGGTFAINIPATDQVNKGLFAFTDVADPTVGDGTVTISIQYTIVDTTIT